MIYLFGDCALDTDRRELRRESGLVEIEPQVFDLLEFLIRTRDRVASRDDLLEAVWQGRIVSESTLSSRLNAARAAIGDDGTAQRLIRTLPRKGVRFVGEVREQQESRPAPTEIAAPVQATVAADWPSIAVLPFTNMSGDRDSDYFADGMVEDIITALSRCGGILVIARNSSFTYKGRAVDVRQVGRELGVRYVLEGSVRRSADRLRITAQLIEASAGTHIWADRFDGAIGDVFELQDQIAQRVAAIIEPRLRLAEVDRAKSKPTQSLDAYDLLLRATSLASEFTADAMASALKHVERALALDPLYPAAIASRAHFLAQCHIQGWQRQSDEASTEAAQAAWRAVKLGKEDANVLWQSAFAIWIFERNAAQALELFRRALQINPNSAIALGMVGWMEAMNGHPAEARELIERAQRLDPLHPRAWFMLTALALTYLVEGSYREAIRWTEKALSKHRHFVDALLVFAIALVNLGEIDRARQVVQEILSIEPRFTMSALCARMELSCPPVAELYIDGLRRAGLPD